MPFIPLGLHKGAVCQAVGFSKGHSEDPRRGPLPNLAVYENKAAPLARRTPGHDRVDAEDQHVSFGLAPVRT
jgi:hypothetical protein